MERIQKGEVNPDGSLITIQKQKMKELWRGWSKCPQKEQEIIISQTYKFLETKKEHLGKLKEETWNMGLVLVHRHAKGTVINGKQVGGQFITYIKMEQKERPSGNKRW